MASEYGNWIFDFEVTDYFTHPKNYTVYKIKSVLFPAEIPESLTSLTVWKRFNEIKKLQINMAKQHKRLHLNGTVPQIKDDNYMNRMKPDTIEHRIEFIVALLNFIAQYPTLYKSYEFLNFFEITRISNQTVQQNIQNIKSITMPIVNNDLVCNVASDKEPNKSTKSPLKTSIKAEQKSSPAKEQPCKIEPMNQIVTRTITLNDYIYDAALKFSEAVRAEVNLNYPEAFQLYKYGIDILIGGARFDVQEERKRIAKDKLQKYMRKAQQIYDCHIMNGSNDTEIILQSTNLLAKTSIERPINQLAKFKVIKILDNVMQVQDVTNKKVYIMKAIDKPSPNNKPNLINLPKNVPFMVPLIAYFNADSKIYLLLQQASGGRLQAYINSYGESQVQTTAILPGSSSSPLQKPASSINCNSNNELNSKKFNCDNLSTTQIDVVNTSSMELLNVASSTFVDFTNLNVRISTIKDYSMNRNLSKIPRRTIKRWASEIATALIYLHSMDIVCMDLHMNNILLGLNGEILLSYFYRQECTQQFAQQPLNLDAIESLYVAPERPLSSKSDWWSFGVILFQLLTGHTFVSCHPAGVSAHFEIQYSDVELDEESQDLLQGLLKTDPDVRFGKTNIQKHNFFRTINWNEMCEKTMDRETEFIYFASS